MTGIQFSVTFDSAAVAGWTPDQRRELLAGLGRVFDALAEIERPVKLASKCAKAAPVAAKPAGRGHGGRPAATAVTVSAWTQARYAMVSIAIPGAIAAQAGITARSRAMVSFGAGGALIERAPAPGTASSSGSLLVRRQSAPTVRLDLGGTKLGVTKAHPPTPCSWRLGDQNSLVIDLPPWWPAPGHVSRRARRTAPEAPPVSVKIVDAPSRKAAIAHHPVSPAAPRKGEAIDGGELIPEENREFHCHTCAAKIATITCDTCNGLFCPSCWSSHLLTHRRPAPAARREEVAHV